MNEIKRGDIIMRVYPDGTPFINKHGMLDLWVAEQDYRGFWYKVDIDYYDDAGIPKPNDHDDLRFKNILPDNSDGFGYARVGPNIFTHKQVYSSSNINPNPLQ